MSFSSYSITGKGDGIYKDTNVLIQHYGNTFYSKLILIIPFICKFMFIPVTFYPNKFRHIKTVL